MTDQHPPVKTPRRRNLPERVVFAPIRELIYWAKDIRSPELKEGYDLKKAAELQRVGENKYLRRRTVRFAAVGVVFDLVMHLGDALAGHNPWKGTSIIAVIVRVAVFAGLAWIAGSIVASNEIDRLKDEYLAKADESRLEGETKPPTP